MAYYIIKLKNEQPQVLKAKNYFDAMLIAKTDFNFEWVHTIVNASSILNISLESLNDKNILNTFKPYNF